MKILAWGQTDIGLKRTRNEDSFSVNQDIGLYVVADGMGGHKGGDLASSMAVDAFRDVFVKHKNNPSVNINDLLQIAYSTASSRIFDKSNVENPELRGMGTTLVCAYQDESGVLHIANVGDSRAYYFKNGKLWQLTEDHSLMNEQLRLGVIEEDELENFAAKNVITRSVGFDRDVECDIIKRQLQKGDMFLLCSDGLSGLVTDDEIQNIMSNTPDDQIVPLCIDQAKAQGGDDNITVLLLKCV